MKICNKCNQEKELNEFCKRADTKDGLHYQCRVCRSNIKKEEYILNKEKKQQYYKDNKDNRIKYQKEYIKVNKQYIKQYNIKWQKENKNYLNLYTKQKIKEDLNFKLRRNIRARILMGLKGKNKSIKTEILIGCDFNKIKQHIESQFKPEMNWTNHGIVWEIDHIKPCSSFDLTNIEQQKQCFHYTNTQPLFKTTEIAESFGYKNEIGNRNKNKYQL